VAWDEIWGSFCDLAMAGGPPHKGTLLEPGSREEIAAKALRHQEVVEEICRGVRMVTDLAVESSPVPGWVRVQCPSQEMAGWLVRAIVMENVLARLDLTAVDLPAGPGYRLEKEIKNVITVIAKTCHYFVDHMWSGQQRDIAELFAKTEVDSPLVQPAFLGVDFDDARHRELSGRMADAVHRATGLRRSDHQYAGWLGLECPSARGAIWMMRALVVSNVLARREGTTLFIPVSPVRDPDGERVVRSVRQVHHFAAERSAL
jgi:hypothetical protein